MNCKKTSQVLHNGSYDKWYIVSKVTEEGKRKKSLIEEIFFIAYKNWAMDKPKDGVCFINTMQCFYGGI